MTAPATRTRRPDPAAPEIDSRARLPRAARPLRTSAIGCGPIVSPVPS
jgi:hypothetical protein